MYKCSSIPEEKPWKMKAEKASLASTQQGLLLACRISLGAGPTCEHKTNLVDKVCNVVGYVERGLAHVSKHVTEKVAKRVDGPTDCDNHAHGIEGSRDGLTALGSSATSFTKEDLRQNEAPATHASKEAHRWLHELK